MDRVERILKCAEMAIGLYEAQCKHGVGGFRRPTYEDAFNLIVKAVESELSTEVSNADKR